MEASLRPSGGLWETLSLQPLVPALRRMVFLQSLTSGGGREGPLNVCLLFSDSLNVFYSQIPVLCFMTLAQEWMLKQSNLTIRRRLHAVQAVALHQWPRQRLVTGAFTQTAPAGLTDKSRMWTAPRVQLHRGFYERRTVSFLQLCVDTLRIIYNRREKPKE